MLASYYWYFEHVSIMDVVIVIVRQWTLTVSRRVTGSSPRPDLNMECGLLLGEVPVHLLGPALVPLSKEPDTPPLPLLPGRCTIAAHCSWY